MSIDVTGYKGHPSLKATRAALYALKYRDVHDPLIRCDLPDENYPSKISNKGKVQFICSRLGLPTTMFHLDIMLPIEDWIETEDRSILNAGLYLSDLRRQMFDAIFSKHPGARQTGAWKAEAEASFWCEEFNRRINAFNYGTLVADARVLN